jgi:Zn-dependent protease
MDALLQLHLPPCTNITIMLSSTFRAERPNTSYLFKLAGVPVHFHYTLPIWAVLELVMALSASRFWLSLLTIPVHVGTVLVHELGHRYAAERCGGECRSIVLWPLGGLSPCSHAGGLANQLKVTLAGPLTHVPMLLLWFLISGGVSDLRSGMVVTEHNFWERFCMYGMSLNFWLLFLNLLVPVYPLDCSVVLAGLLVQKMESYVKAGWYVLYVSSTFLLLLFILGLVWLSPLLLFAVAWMLYQTYGLYTSLTVVPSGVELHPLFATLNVLQEPGTPPYVKYQSSGSTLAGSGYYPTPRGGVGKPIIVNGHLVRSMPTRYSMPARSNEPSTITVEAGGVAAVYVGAPYVAPLDTRDPVQAPVPKVSDSPTANAGASEVPAGFKV